MRLYETSTDFIGGSSAVFPCINTFYNIYTLYVNLFADSTMGAPIYSGVQKKIAVKVSQFFLLFQYQKKIIFFTKSLHT